MCVLCMCGLVGSALPWLGWLVSPVMCVCLVMSLCLSLSLVVSCLVLLARLLVRVVCACVRHAVMCWCGRLGVVCLCHVYVVLYMWCYDVVMWCGSPVGFCMGNRAGYTVGLYDGLVWGCINTTTIDKEKQSNSIPFHYLGCYCLTHSIYL